MTSKRKVLMIATLSPAPSVETVDEPAPRMNHNPFINKRLDTHQAIHMFASGEERG